MKTGGFARAALPAALLLLAVASAAAAPRGSSPACVEDAETAEQPRCQRCAPDGTKCLDCWPGNGLSSGGECVPCNVTSEHGDRCVRCDGDDPSFCTECRPRLGMGGATGYYATADGICSQCPDSYCKICSSLTGACTSCNRWWGAMDGVCRPCVQEHCLQCDGDPSKCTECGYGRFADPGSGLCMNCTDPNCGDCSEGGVDKCSSCASGYTMDKGTGRCVACAEGCTVCDAAGAGRCDEDSCDAGWGPAPSATCLRCPANCTSCDSGAKCTFCDTGFGVWQGACRGCGPDCDACTFGDKGQPQCTSCRTGGLDLATQACAACKQPNCSACMDDASKCGACDNGYRLDEAGACQACAVSNCSMCDDDAARCTLPTEGYRVTTSGGTEACTVAHCSWCSDAAATCESCATGYNLDATANSCYACPANCDSCTNKDTCLTCASGYWRRGGAGTCEQCQASDSTRTECSP